MVEDMKQSIIGTAIRNSLLATLAAIFLRTLLTIGEGSAFCAAATTQVQGITLAADFLSIVVLGAMIRLSDKLRGPNVWLATFGIPLLGFALYVVLRNPCLIGLG